MDLLSFVVCDVAVAFTLYVFCYYSVYGLTT